MEEITKQSIHKEFNDMADKDRLYGRELENPVIRQKITSFYDTKIKQLLEQIVPKEGNILHALCLELAMCSECLEIYSRNQLIDQIKENIKKAGY